MLVKEGAKQEKILIAKNAINNNLNDNTIKIITGLSLEEIKELRNKK